MQCIWSQPDGATTPSARYPPANVTPKGKTVGLAQVFM